MQIYSKVMKGVGKLQFPAMCQGNLGDLIHAVLKSEPSERLQMKQGGTTWGSLCIVCPSPVLRLRSRTEVR